MDDQSRQRGRPQTKGSSMAHNWNKASYSSGFPEATASAIESSKTPNIDALFDSGYDSQTVSKTSIDLESDFDLHKMSLSESHFSDNTSVSRTKSKWTDSGLEITSDSGFNVHEDKEECNQGKEVSHQEHDRSVRVTADLLRQAYESDQDGDTFLHLAIIKGLKDMALALIHIVPHPDLLDIFNHLFQTPLHLAALTRQTSVVRRLIVSGATVDLRDRHGNTVLHIACAQSDSDTVYNILAPISDKERAAADLVYPINFKPLPVHFLELKNYEGETCMHLAAYNKNKYILETLVKSGANVNAQEGKSGKSVLHWSVETQNLDLVQFLVGRCRADVNLRSYAGHTPLHLAWYLSAIHPTNNKLKQIIRFLRDSGAEPRERPTIDSETDSSEDD